MKRSDFFKAVIGVAVLPLIPQTNTLDTNVVNDVQLYPYPHILCDVRRNEKWLVRNRGERNVIIRDILRERKYENLPKTNILATTEKIVPNRQYKSLIFT